MDAAKEWREIAGDCQHCSQSSMLEMREIEFGDEVVCRWCKRTTKLLRGTFFSRITHRVTERAKALNAPRLLSWIWR